MNNLNQDRKEDNNDPARYLRQLEQTNLNLLNQVAECRQQLSHVQLTLAEAQRVLARNRLLETERNTLLVRERELNELKSNFVMLASHEFRTPMMTILSSASLIGRYNGEADADKRERHVQRIKIAVDSLTTMLNDFLTIGQIEQDTVSTHPQFLNLMPFCQEIISEAQVMAKPRQRFHYEHLGQVSALTIDRQMLKNILLNLLSNASKYSADATDIWLTSKLEPELLTLNVSDQGIGIPDTDKDKLFINFFRARNAIHIQGTGLGLYLAKRYVDMLGGTITFTSEVGEGTVFTIQLPLGNKPT